MTSAMKKSKINPHDYNLVFPSGVCQMGKYNVTYYKMGNRLWFDKKDIELVLTGKNQHNLLGQYKDPKNHNKIFDTNRKEVIEVISNKGVRNYLEKARSVSEENRYDFYYGVKRIENPREKVADEPIQMPIFKAEPHDEVEPYINIVQKNGKTEVSCAIEGKSKEERNNRIIQMLLNVASELMSGKIAVKEVA